METNKVRTLSLQDFEDGTVEVGLKVYWRREHAREVTWDPATLIRVNLPEIVGEKSDWHQWHETGDGRWYKQMGSATVESMYGVQVTYSPVKISNVCIPDPEGEEVPITPQYGSMATLTVSMPGVHPDELELALMAFMENLAQGRVTSLSTKPLAERRINVYEFNAGEKGAPIALNILEGEARTKTGYMASYVEEVSRAQVERNMALLRESLGNELDG
jgi:hypothetical protein